MTKPNRVSGAIDYYHRYAFGVVVIDSIDKIFPIRSLTETKAGEQRAFFSVNGNATTNKDLSALREAHEGGDMNRMVRVLALITLAVSAAACIKAEPDYGVVRANGSDGNIDINVNVTVIDNDGDCAIIGGSQVEICQTAATPEERQLCIDEVLRSGGIVVSMCPQGLRTGDCDNEDPTVGPGFPEICDGQDNQCPGDAGYGQIDEGLPFCEFCDDDGDCDSNEFCNLPIETCIPRDCNDDDACTVDTTANHACVNTALPANECCNSDSDCPDPKVCTTQTATVAGRCVLCTTDAQCDDELFCNGVEVCNSENACVPGPAACPLDPASCIEAEDRCDECVHETPAGRCLDCDDDGDCLGNEACDIGGKCEELLCNDNDPCTVDGTSAHACVNAAIPLCCHSPVDDVECASSRPSNLPTGYLWGCSGAAVPPTGLYYCTSCNDADGDEVCGIDEICGNGIDDDGDGQSDETPECVDGEEPPVGGCMDDGNCAANEYCAGGTCAAYTDVHGRTPYGQSGANGGPLADGTADSWDDDADGYCEVAPCLGSADPTLPVASLLGGDCDDDPTDGTQFGWSTPLGDVVTDGSYGNHPGAQEWCESPRPGHDNDCDGVPNDGCPAS